MRTDTRETAIGPSWEGRAPGKRNRKHDAKPGIVVVADRPAGSRR